MRRRRAWAATNRDEFFLNESKKTSRSIHGIGVIVQAVVVAIVAHAGYPMWRVITLAAMYCVFGLSHRFIISQTVQRGRPVDSTFIWE